MWSIDVCIIWFDRATFAHRIFNRIPDTDYCIIIYRFPVNKWLNIVNQMMETRHKTRLSYPCTPPLQDKRVCSRSSQTVEVGYEYTYSLLSGPFFRSLVCTYLL